MTVLSMLLKPFLGKTPEKIELPELPTETELSLSLIESGCMFVLLNDMAALILKTTESEIAALIESDRIYLDFELIKRPEFPSVAVHINIDTGKNGISRFEYFFNIESEEEMDILEKLGTQRYLDILFYDTLIRHAKRTAINKDQKEELASLPGRARE